MTITIIHGAKHKRKENYIMKKALATLLAFAMIVTGFLCLNPNASEVKAATTTSEHGTFKAVPMTEWKDENKDGVPEYGGYLFAGYYKNEDCAKANRASSKEKATHMKFVSDDMLDVKAQVTNGTVSASDVEAYEGKYVIRFVSSVESLNYKNIGFELEYTNDEDEVVKLRNTTSKVFKRIESTTGAANGEIDEYSFSPKVVGEDSEYFMTAKLPVDVEDKAVTYKVRAFWTTFDGTEVMGKTRCVSVNDSNNDIVNMVAEAGAQLEVGADYTATYGPNKEGTGADAVKVEVLSCDAEGHANIRVTLPDGATATGLKSATKFIIKDAEGNQVATAVYRNYYTDKAGTADTSWWDVNPTATRFEIASVSDLYGLASLVNNNKDLFASDEIHLVRNVEINDGFVIRPSESADGVAAWKGTTTAWTPIGTSANMFKGTFDGDNNTISGLYYSSAATDNAGLFAYTGAGATIKNFKLIDSYMKGKGGATSGRVGIVAEAKGNLTMENVYTNAYIEGARAAGFVGAVAATNSIMTFNNCWFDGDVKADRHGAGGFIGVIGAALEARFNNCLSTGTVVCVDRAGGFVGWISSVKANATDQWVFNNCLSVANTTGGTNLEGAYIGGTTVSASAWTMNNSYGVGEKLVGTASGTTPDPAEHLKTEQELIDAELSTLFTSNAWVKDDQTNGTPILASFAEWWKDRQYKAGIDTSWYDPDQEEPYVITTASQLNGLAELAKTNTFENKTIKLGANIVLNKVDSTIAKKWAKGTAVAENIWTPIGTSTSMFKGTFDGDGKTISGLYYSNTATENVGLFAETGANATIKNFKLVDSYMKGKAASPGRIGLVGKANGSITMENVYTNAYVEGARAAGFVGAIAVADSIMTFNNCWFDGEVVSTTNHTGGFVGVLGAKLEAKFNNCLSTGVVEGSTDSNSGGFIGWISAGWSGAADKWVFNNCLSVADVTGSTTYTGAYVGNLATVATSWTMNNSYGVGTKLVGKASSGTTPDAAVCLKTRQELIHADVTELFPPLEGETVNAWVSDGATGWNDTDRGTPILATFAPWWIENVEHDELTVDLSWYYNSDNDKEFTLYDAGDLGGLAYIVNNGIDTFETDTVKLGADIELNKVSEKILASWKDSSASGKQWTPIGTSSSMFKGTFDGQGKTISGLYYSNTATENVGLFAETGANATIKNFKLVDSYMKGKAASPGRIGLVGKVNGTITMENVYTNAYVEGARAAGFVGAIAAANSVMTFNNCWFDGEVVSTTNHTGGFVGVLGAKLEAKFNNCLSTGVVEGSTSSSNSGGFIGWISAGWSGAADKWVFNNCLSVADVTGKSGVTGAYIGNLATVATSWTMNNSYGVGTKLVGTASSGTTPDTAVCLKTRNELIYADETTLFPLLEGETENAWESDAVNGWNDTDRGTPILASFAGWWRENIKHDEFTVDLSWYNDNDKEFTLYDTSDLEGFVYLVNNTDEQFAGKTVKLGADIELNEVNDEIFASWEGVTASGKQWTPIGTSTKLFAGTFDGQGKTISGLYYSSTSVREAGLFAYTGENATIKNFKLVDSYMKGADLVGIVARANGNITIEDVYTNAYVEGPRPGGFVGAVTVEGMRATFNRCWFDGEASSSGNCAGGLISIIGGKLETHFNDCLSTGTVKCSIGRAGGFIGWISSVKAGATDQWVFNNCLSVANVTSGGTNFEGAYIGGTTVSASAWTMNNSYGVGTTLVGTASGTTPSPAVYLKSRQEVVDAGMLLFPTSEAWANDIGWNNIDRGTPILAKFATWWLERNPADNLQARPDISWYDADKTEFTLTTANQMYGFAQLARVYTFENQTVKLGANIVLNEVDGTTLPKWQQDQADGRNWTPIGTASCPFQGTFDGAGYTISGLFLETTTEGSGMFGTTGAKAVICDFKLIDSYMESTVGQLGLIGNGTFTKIEKVYTDAVMSAADNYVGGFIGLAVGSGDYMVISNCWFDGTITQTYDVENKIGINGGVSGFIGNTGQSSDDNKYRPKFTIQDCLNTGSQSGYNRVGGFIGWHAYGDKTEGVMSTTENCLMVGSAASDNASAKVSMFIGDMNTSGKMTITNSYTTGDVVAQGSSIANLTYDAASMVKGRQDLYMTDVNTLFTSGKWVKDEGYNDTNRGTPILADFAEWWLGRQDDSALDEITPNTAWYTGDEPVIASKGDLLGFLSLAKQGETFEGKTIKLGKNITLNAGWEAGAKAPTYQWTPVTFKGNFNGLGHSISGIYVKSSDNNVGFFGQTAAGSTISNFRLLNSYIEQTSTSQYYHYAGSIVGLALGNINNVYSNATVVSRTNNIGGIIGKVAPADENVGGVITISNCWFDGSIEQAENRGQTGGIVGVQSNGKLCFENVLYTGHIKGSHTGNAYVGGILGLVSQGAVGTELESVVSAGTFNIANATTMVGSVVGYFNSGTETQSADYILSNVFTNRGWGTPVTWGGGNGTLTGKVVQTSNEDRLLGYIPQTIAGMDSAQQLDFTTNKTWTMRTNDVPVPTELIDVVSANASNTLVNAENVTADKLTSALGLGTLGKSFTDAVAEGAGDYVITTSGDETLYTTYLSKLDELDFDLFVNNDDTTMSADGILSATYVKGGDADPATAQWAITVTYVANTSEIFVVINGDAESVASTLKAPATTEGDNAISLSMVEDIEGVSITGNCFVFQLPNGHFIINDGNTNGGSGKILKAYLESQVEEGAPIIIDAWTLTHFHNDHGGALMDMVSDATLLKNVYVDALYVNEASMYAQTRFTEGGSMYTHTQKILEGARRLQRSATDPSSPVVYQVHMGQRYYFNGITMDIVNTPDQIADNDWGGGGTSKPTNVPDPSNSSSINFVFTIHDNDDNDDNNKKVLLGGDTTAVNMRYIMGAYGTDNSTLANINVFAAYHHGKNVMNTYKPTHITVDGVSRVHISATGNNDWADYLLKNNGGKFDVMLFPHHKRYSATLDPSKACDNSSGCAGKPIGDDGTDTYPYNIRTCNEYYATKSEVHFTTGYDDKVSADDANAHGTVKITFNANDTISWIAYESLHSQEPESYEMKVYQTSESN